MLYAAVIVKQKTNVEELTYSVPAHIVPYIKVGSLVEVPLHRRTVAGVVVSIHKSIQQSLRNKVRDISQINKDNYGFNEAEIKSLKDLSDYYAASLAEVAFHALAYPHPLFNNSLTSSTRKPLFLHVSWNKREDFYNQLIIREIKNKRILFLFSSTAYAEFFYTHLPEEIKKNVISNKDVAANKRKIQDMIRHNLPGCIIGTLNRAFVPLRSEDILVIDQPDFIGGTQKQRPFMSLKRIALTRSKNESLNLILGAELLFVSDYSKRLYGDWKIIESPVKPYPITIISRKNTREIIMPNIIERIKSDIQLNKKILAVVESKSWSAVAVCSNCEQPVYCQNCGRITSAINSLTLRCSYCHFKQNIPEKCPHCNNNKFFFIGSGTKRIIELLQLEFPGAQINELSSDQPEFIPESTITISTEKILNVPGIQFNSVYLLSIDRMLAGSQLNGEWQLLSMLLQLKNRTESITVQTRFPDHYIWNTLATGNLSEFYANQLSQRRRYKLPPYIVKFDLVATSNSLGIIGKQFEEIIVNAKKFLPNLVTGDIITEQKLGPIYQISVPLYVANRLHVNQKRQLRTILPPNWHVRIS